MFALSYIAAVVSSIRQWVVSYIPGRSIYQIGMSFIAMSWLPFDLLTIGPIKLVIGMTNQNLALDRISAWLSVSNLELSIPISCFIYLGDYIHVVFIPMMLFHIFVGYIHVVLDTTMSCLHIFNWLYPCCFHTNGLFHIFVGYIHVVIIANQLFHIFPHWLVSMLFSFQYTSFHWYLYWLYPCCFHSQWVVSYICWLYPCCFHTNELFHISAV